MHWFYGILLMLFFFYLIFKYLPEPQQEKENSTKKEVVSSNSKSKKKKNKKTKAKAQAQVQAKLNQKIQKKNTPPKGKTNELDENEWPSLEKINEEKKAASLVKSKKQKNQINKNNTFNITHYEDENSEDINSSSNLDDNEEHVRKSSDKPIVIQNVSLPITNRKKYKKHIVQENQKYISSDDEEISDREVKVVRIVEKKEDIESIELPPEVDGWKNVVPKKAKEPLTKKQKENRKKAEKKKLEKQRERELQEERLRLHKLEQRKQNIGYKYVPPPKPSTTVKPKAKATSVQSPVQAPVVNNSNKKSNKKNENAWVTAKVPADGITSLWGS
eukprot:jgi/Orpsp1_1/1192517/evm.model.d7180000093929.1